MDIQSQLVDLPLVSLSNHIYKDFFFIHVCDCVR